MSFTIKGVEGGLVSSVRITAEDGPHVRVEIWNRGAHSGTLTLRRDDSVMMLGRLLGPQAHEGTEAGSILERCISLVQSIANAKGDGDEEERLYAYQDEANGIAHDAGWS